MQYLIGFHKSQKEMAKIMGNLIANRIRRFHSGINIELKLYPKENEFSIEFGESDEVTESNIDGWILGFLDGKGYKYQDYPEEGEPKLTDPMSYTMEFSD